MSRIVFAQVAMSLVLLFSGPSWAGEAEFKAACIENGGSVKVLESKGGPDVVECAFPNGKKVAFNAEHSDLVNNQALATGSGKAEASRSALERHALNKAIERAQAIPKQIKMAERGGSERAECPPGESKESKTEEAIAEHRANKLNALQAALPKFDTVRDIPFATLISPSEAAKIKTARELADKILEKMHEQSEHLVTKIEASNQSERPFVVDVVGIGAGPHNGAAFSALAEQNPQLRRLVFEASDKFGVFDNMGGGFHVNTRELPSVSGNLFSGSPVQPKDFNSRGEKFVSSQVFGDVTRMMYATSETPVAFRQKVESVEKVRGERPAKYKVTTSYWDESGKVHKLVVYTNAVIAGTGMGKTELPSSIEAPTRALYKKEEDEADKAYYSGNLNYMAGVQSVDSYLRWAPTYMQKTKRNPQDKLAGKTVAVIGGGDGGSIAIEGVAGVTDEIPGVGAAKVHWFTGGKDLTTADKFIESYKPKGKPTIEWDSKGDPNGKNLYPKQGRYLGVAKKINDGTVISTPGHLEKIEVIPADGKNPSPRYKVTYTGGKSVIVDHVIMATGYQNRAPEMMDRIPGWNNPMAVSGNPKDYTHNVAQGSRVELGKKIRGESIYYVGNAAETMRGTSASKAQMIKDMTNEGGLNEWKTSYAGGYIDILSARAAKVGSVAATAIGRSITGVSEGPTTINYGKYDKGASDTIPPVEQTLPMAPAKTAPDTGEAAQAREKLRVAEMLAKIDLTEFLEKYRLPKKGASSEQGDTRSNHGMTLRIGKGVNSRAPTISVLGVDPKHAKLVIKDFLAQERLPGLLVQLANSNADGNLSIDLQPRSDGVLRTESMKFNYEKPKVALPRMSSESHF